MLTALQIGVDTDLLATRSALLQSAGLRVVSVAPTQAVDAIRATPFNLAVLCHSLTRAHRASLTAAIRRRNPSAPVLLVSHGPGIHLAEKDGMDAVLEPEPQRLLEGLRAVLGALRSDGKAGTGATRQA